MRPYSRGFIKLKSNNPREYPIIEPNLLEDNRDLIDLCESIKLSIEILNANALKKHNNGPINFKENMVFDNNKIEEWVKKHAESAYHCSGTLAMGKVTESDGKVKGLKNLRVCDASIMPYVTSGNTNAPTIMMAEKISDCIKGKTLPTLNTKFYIEENFELSQR